MTKHHFPIWHQALSSSRTRNCFERFKRRLFIIQSLSVKRPCQTRRAAYGGEKLSKCISAATQLSTRRHLGFESSYVSTNVRESKQGRVSSLILNGSLRPDGAPWITGIHIHITYYEIKMYSQMD